MASSTFLNGEKRPKQGDYHIEDVAKKVTIILLILFRLAYNKVHKDLYNLIWIANLQVFSSRTNLKFSGGLHVWFE
jgi:hypothetical protein